MKPSIDNLEKSPIDASNKGLDGNNLAACDLIDTACKKLSCLSSRQKQPLPGFNQILNSARTGFGNDQILLPVDQQNGYQFSQPLKQEQPTRKPSFFSTTSTNFGYGIGAAAGKPCIAFAERQNINEKKSQVGEDSKLIYHDEEPGYFPIRYVIILMSTLATFVSYTIRVNMSVTLVAMVGDGRNDKTEQLSLSQSFESVISESIMTTTQSSINLTQESPDSKLVLVSNEKLSLNNLDWSESIQGVALGAFYWGFILTHVLGGQLANIFSARLICACSILTASLLTLILPMAANFSVYSVILLRMITGLCLGIVAPALYTLSSRWVPQNERSTAIAIRMIGGNMGAVSAMSISGYLSDLLNWESVFYVIGIFGCIVFVLWIYLVSDSPQEHSWIGARELKLIQANTDYISSNQAKTIKLDWVSMMKSSQLWAVAIAKFCGSWGNLMLMQKLPTYLETVLSMPIGKNGLVNALVYISMSISLFVFGCLSDYVCTNQPRSQRTTTRVLFELIALLGPAICLAFVPICGHSQDAVIALLIVAMVLYGMTAGGDNPIVVEMAPDFPGTLYGVTNAIASIPGFMAPIIVGFMLDSSENSNQHQWSMIFFVTSGIYAVGAIAFMLMANADVQSWGVADFRKREILERKLDMQQQSYDSDIYDYENHTKNLLFDEEANVTTSDQQYRNQHQINRRISRFENSINLLEQHHFNIGSFNNDSMRVRNI